jgi:hypothetical protein
MISDFHYRTYPILNKVLKVLGRKSDLDRVAVARDVICPETTSVYPPVFMLEGDEEAIVSTPSWSTKADEMRRVAGGARVLRAATRHIVRNVLATPRGCYVLGTSFNQVGRISLRELFTGPIERHDKGFHAETLTGVSFFAHWLLDGLPLALLCREDERLYLPDKLEWPHTTQYLDMTGLTPIRARLAVFGEMSVARDRGTHGIGRNSDRGRRLRLIRDRIRARLPAPSAPGVFIRRGVSGNRRVLRNEDEVAAALAARGFNVCTSTDPLDVILAACSGVGIVVSVEGSHMSHGILAARAGALIVVINPADRFTVFYSAYLEALDQRLATIVAPRHDDGYHVEVARLLRLIDEASSAMAAR